MNAELKVRPRRPTMTADACPHCSTPVVNVQGLADCPRCDWTDR